MKKVILSLFIFLFSLSSFAQELAIVGTDTTKRPPNGLFKLAIKGGYPFVVKSSGNALKIALKSDIIEPKILFGAGDITNSVSLTANLGDLYINTTSKAVYKKTNLSFPSGLTYIILPSGTWVKIGNFLVTKADLALDNVDNTSDANKPISTATQNALNDKITGNNYYTGNYGFFTSQKIYGVPAPPDYLANPFWVNQYVDADNVDLQMALGINSKETVIGNGTTSQFWRGDKTWQEFSSLPISSATQTALNAKENTFTKGNITSSDITVTGGTGAVIGSGVGLSVAASGRQKILYGAGDVTNGVSVTANYGDLYLNTTDFSVYEKSNLSYPSGLTYIVLPDATWVKVGKFSLTKNDVGLSNVDNTSDLNKPISTATQTALNAKENILTKGNITSSDITVTGGTGAVIGSGVGLTVGSTGRQRIFYGTSDVTDGTSVGANIGDLYINTTSKAVYEKSSLSYPSGLTYIVISSGTWVKLGNFSLTKSDVGLANVDNTSDVNKPVSTATQTALDAKLSISTASSTYLPLAGGTLTGQLFLPYSVRVGGTSFFGGNTYLGKDAYVSNNLGANNTAIGDGALKTATSAISNTAIGQNALNLTTGGSNTSVGVSSMEANTSGQYNTSIGVSSMYFSQTGSYNTAVGAYAGQYNKGGGNSFFGGYTATSERTRQNSMFLADGAGGLKIFADSLNNVGIGTTRPSQKLDVNGNVNISTGNAYLQNGSNLIYKGGNYSIIADALGVNKMYLGSTGDPNNYYDNTGHNFRNSDGTTTYMRISSAGNVGIGTTSPIQKFHVAGYGLFENGIVGNGGLSMYGDNSSPNGMFLSTGGNLGIGGAGTSYRINTLTSTAGSSIDGINISVNDATANIAHTSKFMTQQLGGGAARTLIYAASATTGTSEGELAVLTETGSRFLSTLGKSYSGTNSLALYNDANTAMANINTGGNSFFNGGNVGIGTTNPTNKLHIVGGNTIAGGWVTSSLLEAAFPIALFKSTAHGTYGGIGYNGTTAMNFWVNSSSENVSSVGTIGLSIKTSNAYVGIGKTEPTSKLDVNGTAQALQFKVSALNTSPASAIDTGTVGEIRVTAGYIYVCTATNTWVRSALTTW